MLSGELLPCTKEYSQMPFFFKDEKQIDNFSSFQEIPCYGSTKIHILCESSKLFSTLFLWSSPPFFTSSGSLKLQEIFYVVVN